MGRRWVEALAKVQREREVLDEIAEFLCARSKGDVDVEEDEARALLFAIGELVATTGRAVSHS